MEKAVLEAVPAGEQAVRLKCVSCGVYIKPGRGSVDLPCPGCGQMVARCINCRKLGRRYFHACGFEGP